MQTVCDSGSNFLPQCVEGTSNVHIIRCSQGLFWRGRDIEINQWLGSSDIDGQDQCEHMLNLVTVIAIFWVHRENHKNTKQWVFGQTAQVHILLENLAYGQWCRRSLKSPLLNKGFHTSKSRTRHAQREFYCLPVKYTNPVYWDRLSFWVILKDKDYCPIEIIKGLTDKGQFQ